MKLPYFALRDHIQPGGLRGSNDLYNMLYVGFAWGEAAFLTVGGPGRWQGEAFTLHRQVPGAPYTWAAALFLASLVLAVGVLMADASDENKLTKRGWLIVSGAFACALWCIIYAICLWKAGQLYPTQVSFGGTYQWSFFALWYLVKVGQHLELKYWKRT